MYTKFIESKTRFQRISSEIIIFLGALKELVGANTTEGRLCTKVQGVLEQMLFCCTAETKDKDPLNLPDPVYDAKALNELIYATSMGIQERSGSRIFKSAKWKEEVKSACASLRNLGEKLANESLVMAVERKRIIDLRSR